MEDVQRQNDYRQVPLQKVGIKGLCYPITVLDKLNKTQITNASVDLFVNLPKHYKGTHMSRFVEVFHKYHKNLERKNFLAMLQEIRAKLQAINAFGAVTFPFFLEKAAPVSKQKSIMSYTCCYEGEVATQKNDFFLSVCVPVTTLCPCSKAISEYGAHNQRATVKVRLLSKHFFWLEDIIDLVEKTASAPLYSLLKRPDEKYVTQRAYDNPRFVEDIAREVYLALKGLSIFQKFSIEVESLESIHNHNAYAFTQYVAQGA